MFVDRRKLGFAPPKPRRSASSSDGPHFRSSRSNAGTARLDRLQAGGIEGSSVAIGVERVPRVFDLEPRRFEPGGEAGERRVDARRARRRSAPRRGRRRRAAAPLRRDARWRPRGAWQRARRPSRSCDPAPTRRALPASDRPRGSRARSRASVRRSRALPRGQRGDPRDAALRPRRPLCAAARTAARSPSCPPKASSRLR